MPNWCENELEVYGDADAIKEFKNAAVGEDTVLSIKKLVPMPEYLLDRDSPGPKPNWHTWALENWGTKWDTDEARLYEEDEDYLAYFFLTAWSPPIAWLGQVAKGFPRLTFVLTYDEPGCGYKGVAVSKKGKVRDQTIEY